MALHLRLEFKTLRNLRIRCLSSSSAPPPHAPPPVSNSSGDDTSDAPPSASSSYFSEIKEWLKSPPSPPRRIPDNPPPPPPLTDSKPNPAASFEEIRKHLADFRRRSGVHPPSSAQQSSPPTLSFQELFKNNAIGKVGDNNRDGAADKHEPLSFNSIRESLRQFRGPRGSAGQPQNSFNLKLFQENLRNKVGDPQRNPSILGRVDAKLPDSIFGRELREKEQEGGREPKALDTVFMKEYSYEDLGNKLRQLRPEVAAKGGNDWFSLSELNERLAKLRELEEELAQSNMRGINFRDLRESLLKLREAETNRITNMQNLNIIVNIGGQATPPYMLKPPQEHLFEKYYHPDHMSSAEKMKLELKKVRDEFKTSESDCGSTRVQVAQLTTKIKHLSTTLHKKDKHSRKGLQEMVQRRKKLLKYLRRTDWDSYCLVLSRLGLRDVPEYKTPDYKS